MTSVKKYIESNKDRFIEEPQPHDGQAFSE